MTTLSRFLLAAVLVAFISGAVAAETTHGEEKLVWPYGAANPRIKFVRAFASADDIGISKGFFARVSDFLFGASAARIIRPMAVATAGGAVFVADPGARGVHRFDVAGGDYALLTATDNAPLPSPVGLARGANGDVYVTDAKLAQVFVIRRGAKAAQALPLQATLKQPTGIAFDPVSGRLYVTDTAQHQVLVFAPGGALEARIGTRGNGDGEFNFPTYLWRTPQGHLFVTDTLNFRIQHFDEHGRFIGKFGRQGDGTGEAARPKGVALDGYGHIYVVDALFHALQIFDDAGRLLLPVGEQGQGRGEFWLPTGIFIDDDNTIYVADSYNRRVQVLRYIGGAS